MDLTATPLLGNLLQGFSARDQMALHFSSGWIQCRTSLEAFEIETRAAHNEKSNVQGGSTLDNINDIRMLVRPRVEMKRRHLLQECSATVAAILFISFVSALSAGGSVAPRTRACTDLRIGAEGSSAAAGEASMVFLIANAGSSCTLGGYPKVTFWGAKGNVIATSKVDLHSSSIRSVKFTLDHDSVASFEVTWTDIPIRSQVSHQATGATIVLPKRALARYSVFSVEELLYGKSLGVSPLRLGPTP